MVWTATALYRPYEDKMRPPIILVTLTLFLQTHAAAPPRTRRAKTAKPQPLTPPRPPAEVEPCPHAPDCPSCTIDGGFDEVDTARRARAMFEPLLDKPFEIIC